MNYHPDSDKPIIVVTVNDYYLPKEEYLKGIFRFLIVYPMTIVGYLWVGFIYLFVGFVAYSIIMYILLWFGILPGGLPERIFNF
jgi:hypothetical protein